LDLFIGCKARDFLEIMNLFHRLMNFSQNLATGKVAIVEELLKYADAVTALTSQDADGNTCLMKACEKGNIDVVTTLIDRFGKVGYKWKEQWLISV
jgi:ankyrin repeat protein